MHDIIATADDGVKAARLEEVGFVEGEVGVSIGKGLEERDFGVAGVSHSAPDVVPTLEKAGNELRSHVACGTRDAKSVGFRRFYRVQAAHVAVDLRWCSAARLCQPCRVD